MRQVSIALTCDPCLAWKGLDNGLDVTTVPVVGTHSLDLCPEHLDGMRAVLALIGEYADGAAIGVPASAHLDPATRRKVHKAVDKAQADHEAARAAGGKRRGGKRARARREAAEAETTPAVGLACPLCGAVSATSDNLGKHLRNSHGLTPDGVYGLACPICGQEAATGRALGSHGRREHDTHDGVPGLFLRATADGDPLGIVAARAQFLANEAGGE